MTRLSVNINKVATLRNARGGNLPDLVQFALDVERLGADGITIHPRPDERHIRRQDAFDLSRAIVTELNIEGNPTDEFRQLVREIRPQQVTLVPDAPSTLTSNAGWQVKSNFDFLQEVVGEMKELGIRTSIFVDTDADNIAWASQTGVDRVELYTGPYAEDYARRGAIEDVIHPYTEASELARSVGLGVNAGHDLSLSNLQFFVMSLPYLDEVSIGHALISEALYLGIGETMRRYQAIL